MAVTFPKVLDAWVKARKDGYQAAVDKQKADGTPLGCLNEKIGVGKVKLERNRARWEAEGEIEGTYNTLVAKASRAFDRFEYYKTLNTGMVLNGLQPHEIAIILEFHQASSNVYELPTKPEVPASRQQQGQMGATPSIMRG